MTIPDCQWTCFNQCIVVFSCFPTTYLHKVNLLFPLSLHFSSGTSNNPLPAPIVSLSTNGDSLDSISIVLPFSIPEVVHLSLKLKLCFNKVCLNIFLDQSNFTISDNIITVNLTDMDSFNPGAYEVTYSLSFFGETPEMSPPETFDSKFANTVYQEIFVSFYFVNFANFKVLQNFINVKSNCAHVSDMCTYGNKLNGPGQKAG